MKLYIYGDGKGNYYKGRSPSGKVRYTKTYTTAVFFTEEEKEDAEDCIDLGLNLYALEVSEPTLVSQGTVSTAMPAIPTQTFEKWEAHSMDLFGSNVD